MFEDTICAPATSPLNSTLAIIRISGPDSLKIISKIFSKPERLKPRMNVYGCIIDRDNVLIDDVVVASYSSPNSFTGEDSIEIYCHGNPLIVNKILKLLHRNNVRMAEPGEFSKRAFLNGKIDLTAAEAINHIIRARSEWEIDAALKQMHGAFKCTIDKIRDKLVLLKADFECSIDFVEEDVEFISYEDAVLRIGVIQELVNDVHQRCRIGEKMTHGIDIPIVGKPNVGKSSILNLILNSERAIVSSIPGTTRDMISEIVQFAGMQVNLIDTAGIDRPACEIEEKGIALSTRKIESSGIVLMVLDLAKELEESDRKILETIKDKCVIYIANKIDLVPSEQERRFEAELGSDVIPMSAKTGAGLDLLEIEIARIIRKDYIEYKNSFISDFRIVSILERAIKLLKNLVKLVEQQEPYEIIAFEIQSLIDTLMEITGEITPDDILNSIFSRFCIGK